jgi:hypothetical protein
VLEVGEPGVEREVAAGEVALAARSSPTKTDSPTVRSSGPRSFAGGGGGEFVRVGNAGAGVHNVLAGNEGGGSANASGAPPPNITIAMAATVTVRRTCCVRCSLLPM